MRLSSFGDVYLARPPTNKYDDYDDNDDDDGPALRAHSVSLLVGRAVKHAGGQRPLASM